MSDHSQNGPEDPKTPEESKEPAAPQTPPPGQDGAQPFYMRPPFMVGVVVAIVLVAAVVFFMAPSGDKGQDQQAKADVPANDVANASGWELGRPGDIVMGSPDAPVKLVEYASVTCGHCAAFQLAVFPDIKKKYIDTGLVQYTLREFPTPPAALAVRGFMLARCVGEDRYYPAIDALFRTQRLWIKRDPREARDQLAKISLQFGLNEAEFQSCIQDEQELERIKQVVQAGSELYGINSTPSFVINGRKANIHSATFESLDSAIRESLPPGTEVPEYTPAGLNTDEPGQPEATEEGTSEEGADDEGTSEDGASEDGTADDGATGEGAAEEATSDEGASEEGASGEGTADDGATDEGTAEEATSDEGATDEGTSSDDGSSDEGASDEGASEDSGDGGKESAPESNG